MLADARRRHFDWLMKLFESHGEHRAALAEAMAKISAQFPESLLPWVPRLWPWIRDPVCGQPVAKAVGNTAAAYPAQFEVLIKDTASAMTDCPLNAVALGGILRVISSTTPGDAVAAANTIVTVLEKGPPWVAKTGVILDADLASKGASWTVGLLQELYELVSRRDGAEHV